MEKIVDSEVSLVITSDSRIQEINRTYRRVDAPTDVIAFALRDETDEGFISPPDGLIHLGELVVSYPMAVQQAQEQSHSIQQELAILIVHGILHLLGYDHEAAGPARKMRAREREILGYLKGKELC